MPVFPRNVDWALDIYAPVNSNRCQMKETTALGYAIIPYQLIPFFSGVVISIYFATGYVFSILLCFVIWNYFENIDSESVVIFFILRITKGK